MHARAMRKAFLVYIEGILRKAVGGENSVAVAAQQHRLTRHVLVQLCHQHRHAALAVEIVTSNARRLKFFVQKVQDLFNLLEFTRIALHIHKGFPEGKHFLSVFIYKIA